MQPKNFSDFRRYVLLKTQNDLQKHTNMMFSFETKSRGKGRKITHIIFDFSTTQDRKTPQLKAAPDWFKPEFNLRERLKENDEISTEQVNTVMRWLAENQY